ncbi:hypothetical protein NM688_g2300 [Phlebia brevispora]|uniref:Uncharacterized protein n=1 Tax=Phlebia brevispora TaxID=194682 RepID=A0ACC1T970_9APHY|nr:hypothetical protein NM688_g2300 [Phlebia brevispora]
MRLFTVAASFAAFVLPSFAQQIWDVYTTTWDRQKLFTYDNLGPNPINFVTPGAIGQADIVINDNQGYQSIWGHGGALTDSSASLLIYMKDNNPSNYWSLLGYLFDPTDGDGGAGLTYVRVPLGASDFSASSYTYDDSWQDTSLNDFNINMTPSEVFTILNDIKGINPYLKPGWMKDSGSINGGNFLDQYTQTYANYLLKCLQGFQSHGITAYAIGIQNEPMNSNPSYPTCKVSQQQEANVATALRSLMNSNGFSGTRIIAFDHNWSDAGDYAVDVVSLAPNAFDGVAFHCYGGSVSDQDTFHSAYPQKEIYFTECTGSMGSDWWSDIKWYMDNLYIGALEHNSHNALMWNLVLDPNGWPELPSSGSCRNPSCRGIVTMSGTSWTVNQEFYAMAQASKAIVPKDVNGPWGKRIGVTVGGSLSWALRVGAYVTGRVNPSDWLRYSIVVLNWDDSASTTWNPQDVTATIEFRGMQATYTFPVRGHHALVPAAVNATATNGTAIPSYTATVSFVPSASTSIASASASTAAHAPTSTNATITHASVPASSPISPVVKIRGANWFNF